VASWYSNPKIMICGNPLIMQVTELSFDSLLRQRLLEQRKLEQSMRRDHPSHLPRNEVRSSRPEARSSRPEARPANQRVIENYEEEPLIRRNVQLEEKRIPEINGPEEIISPPNLADVKIEEDDEKPKTPVIDVASDSSDEDLAVRS